MKKLLRVIFSRYFISGLFILFDLLFIFGMIAYASTYSYIALILFFVANLVTVISLINREANPEYKVSWLVCVLVLPIFGMVLYLAFYSRREPKRKVRLMRDIEEKLNRSGCEGEVEEFDKSFKELKDEGGLAHGKALALLSEDPLSKIYRGSSAKYFSRGEKLYEQMLRDVALAEKYIFIEYFIIEEGVMWDKLLSLLKEKASCGVEVRLLYDDIGSMKTFSHKYRKRLCACGIKCEAFSKITPTVSAGHNNRDHRKILIIDGKYAYTGGVNIADEYINEKDRFGHWKDGGVRVCGLAVEGLLRLFLSLWSYTVGVCEDYTPYLKKVEECENADGGFYIPFGCGPAPIYSRPVAKNMLLNLINQAEESLYMTSPYLIIDYELTEAIKCASARGVDVRIITPGRADKRLVKLMTKSAYPPLIEGGVRIYEYTPGFIHEKLLVSDGKYAVCGTINLDYRSLAHHFEDAVWMYKSDAVSEIESGFFDTLSLCCELRKGEVRFSALQTAIRSIIRIFAPLL